MKELENLKFDDSGLIPVIVQDLKTKDVLMLAYANREALELTISTGKSHFWSRSRKKIWRKGEESGNHQEVKGIYFDCDGDTVLYIVEQKGVACHTGNQTCFYRALTNRFSQKEKQEDISKEDITYLEKVFSVIEERKNNPKEGSYVSSLMRDDIERVLKKIGEEASETIISALKGKKEELVYELADLWFHSLVLMARKGITPFDIDKELERRFGKTKDSYKLK